MIPDEAVEVAAKAVAVFVAERPNDYDQSVARAVLKAATPIILAQELFEVADDLADMECLNTSGAISNWLRLRGVAILATAKAPK